MAQLQPKAKPLYKSRTTGYIYSVAYRVTARIGGKATPSGEVELVTLAFHGKHPEYENTIVTTGEDFSENFTLYNPIQSTTPGDHQRPEEATKE